MDNIIGCKVDDILIHPREAYIKAEDWLWDFEAKFPDKSSRMRKYSKEQGWTDYYHNLYWTIVCIMWLEDLKK